MDAAFMLLKMANDGQPVLAMGRRNGSGV